MDWYFALCIIVFFTVGIVMIYFAFQGPRCIDFDDSQYEEILKEEQESRQNINLTMPLPHYQDEDEIIPAVSLTSPYPQKPPPLGFGRILAERNVEVVNSYPEDEDVCRMPFPTPIGSFSYVDPPSNFTKRNPPQPETSQKTLSRSMYSPHVSTQTNVACNIRNEPPPPYTEAIGQSQQPTRTRRNRFKKRLSQ